MNPGDQFVQIHDRARDSGHRRKGRQISIGRQRGLALAHQLTRGGRCRDESLQVSFVETAQDRTLFRARLTVQRLIEYPVEPCAERLAAMRDGVLREHTGGLDVNRIVQQVECLQRRVRRATIHRAFFTRGRIEVQQAGMEIRTLPRRVQAAAVQIGAVARGVLTLGKIERPKIRPHGSGSDARASGFPDRCRWRPWGSTTVDRSGS